MNDKIYPSMVIRSQAEAIELLEQENKQLKDKLEFYSGLELDKTIDKTRLEYNKLQQENKKYKEAIDKAIEILDNYQNNLYSKSARKFLDDDIERTITILKEVDL